MKKFLLVIVFALASLSSFHTYAYDASNCDNSEEFVDERKSAYEDSLCLEAIKYAKTKVPNGYVEDWGWDNDYGTLDLWIEIKNTNKKRIKYVAVYWKSMNDVDDVRNSGVLKGTGPIDSDSYGKWHWDNTLSFLSGDVTYVVITKIIITYMNGTKATLSLAGKTLKFHDDVLDIESDYFWKHYKYKE